MEAKLYSKNYVSADDVITASSGASGIANLYDRDRGTLWKSVGSSDGVMETLDVTFYEGSVATNRTFTVLILLNHNLKEYYLDRYASGAWTNLYSQTNETTTDTVIVLSSATDSRARLRADKTQGGSTDKQIGQLIIANLSLAFPRDPSIYSEKWAEEAAMYELFDGTVEKVMRRRTANRLSKYTCDWGVKAWSEANRDSLFALKEAGTPVLWQPRSVSRPKHIFLVQFDPGTWDEKPSYLTSNLIDINARFVEV